MNYFVKRLSHGNGSGRLCNSVLRSEPFCLSFTYMELIAFCLSLIPKVVAFLVFMVIKNSTYSECVIIPSLCLDSTMSAYSLWRLWRLLISNSIPQGERIRSLRAWMALFFCVSAAATSLILAVGLVAVLPGGIIPVSRSLLWTVSYGNWHLATCSPFAGHCINPLPSILPDSMASVVALDEVCAWHPKWSSWRGCR